MPKDTKPRPTNKELPGLENPHDVPWMRQKGESWQAFEAFACYRDFGPTRTHAKVGQAVGKHRSTLEEWSTKWMWVDRAASFDANESFERMQRMKEARIRLWEGDAAIARKIKDKVVKRLESMAPSEMSITQMLQAFKLAHEIETSALGAGNQNMESESPAVDQEMLDLEKWLDENPELADVAAGFIRSQRQQAS
jgi:hypothetical protein